MPSEFDTVNTQITKPSPVIEGSLTAFLKSIDKLGAGAYLLEVLKELILLFMIQK